MSLFDRGLRLTTEPVTHEDGQAMAEYSLLVALIAVVVLVGAQTLGESVLALLQSAAGLFK